MSEDVFDARRRGFVSYIMSLAKPGEREIILIGNLALLNIVVKQELGFQLYDEFIQRNVQAAKLSCIFTCFTGKNGEKNANLVFFRYVGRGQLIQDRTEAKYKQFFFISSGTFFSREEVREDLDALG